MSFTDPFAPAPGGSFEGSISYGPKIHIGTQFEATSPHAVRPQDANWITGPVAIQDARPDQLVQVGAVMRNQLYTDAEFGLASGYAGASVYCDGRLYDVPNWAVARTILTPTSDVHYMWFHPTQAMNTWSRGSYTPRPGSAAARTGSWPIRMGVSSAFVAAIAVGEVNSSIAVVNRATGVATALFVAAKVTAGPLVRGTKLLYYANDPAQAGHTRRVVVDLATGQSVVERSDPYLVFAAPVAPAYLTDVPRLTTTGVLLMDDDQIDLDLEHDGTETVPLDAYEPFSDEWYSIVSTGGTELRRTTLSVSSNYILATTIPVISGPILQRSVQYTPLTEGGTVRAILWQGDTELDFGAHRSKGHFS